MNPSPPKWQPTTLGEVAKLVGGGTPSRSNGANFGRELEWVTPTDLAPIGEVRILGAVSEGLSAEGLANSSAVRIPPGSVLFSSRATIGKIAVTDRECATNQGFANFVPHPDKIDPWFLAYLLSHLLPSIIDLCGETTYKEVSRGKLRDLPIRVPEITVQRQIVGRITAAFERIDEVCRLSAEAKAESRLVFRELLTAAFDALRIPTRVTLAELIVDTRYGTSRKCDRSSGVPVLRIPNVVSGQINFDDLKYTELSDRELKALALQPGDVLIVRTNGSPELVGRSAVFDSQNAPFAFASYLIRLRVDRARLNPRFLSLFLESGYGRQAIAACRKTSAGQFNVNSTNLLKFELPLPDPKVQEEFVEAMTYQRRMADEVGERLSARLAGLPSIRAAVLQDALREAC